MEINKSIKARINRYTDGSFGQVDDELAIEEPLEIRINYFKDNSRLEKKVSITMRTPGNDSELATGFLFTEGIIMSSDEVKRIEQNDENVITIHLSEESNFDVSGLNRNFYTTSSCGVCGKASIDAIMTTSSFTVNPTFNINEKLLLALPEKLKQEQAVFKSTGGLHASALYDAQGNLLCLREDVGRHNALDKLIGAQLAQKKVPLDNTILLLSGRASFELIQKAGMAAIPCVAAIGAPSSLAVNLAQQLNIKLYGFLKSDRFNRY
jgi:FdhD protein